MKTCMKLAVQGYAITREKEYIKGFFGLSLFHPRSKENVCECVYINSYPEALKIISS